MHNGTKNMPGGGRHSVHNMPGSGVNSSATGGGHMMMNHAMSPYLFGNKRDFFVLFNEAKVTTAAGLAVAIIVSFVFALLSTMFNEYSKLLEKSAARAKQRISGLLLVSTVSFAFRLFLHYVAMLIVMTMNVWLIIAVVFGHGVGHFIFAVSFQPKHIEAGCEC